MLSKEETEMAKAWLSSLDVKSEYEAISKEIILSYIEQLEIDNKNLNMILEKGLNKEKQYCFNEDGNTGKCLGYGDDEPCDYCKSCERINIKEEQCQAKKK